MRKRGPEAAAKRRREGEKRAKREAKQERRTQRAEERAKTKAPRAHRTPGGPVPSSVEYNGYLIEPTTRLRTKPPGWSLEVRITPVGRRTGVRRCRAPNRYPTEEAAVANCLRFGRKIVDGELTPRSEPNR